MSIYPHGSGKNRSELLSTILITERKQVLKRIHYAIENLIKAIEEEEPNHEYIEQRKNGIKNLLKTHAEIIESL